MTSTKFNTLTWQQFLDAVRKGVPGAYRAARRCCCDPRNAHGSARMTAELEQAQAVAEDTAGHAHPLTPKSIEVLRPTIDALANGGAT